MIRVGLARTEASYRGVAPPWSPGKAYPEITAAFGDGTAGGPFNATYAAVRAALLALGLDASRFGTPGWNPLGSLMPRGGRVVLKPNFIRHWNPAPDGSMESVITHGSIVRAVADYAFIAAGSEGSVVVAEAPQQDCDFSRIEELTGLRTISRFYEQTLRRELEIIDLRREVVRFRDGVIVERSALAGDPAGYRAVDLGDASFFHGSGLEARRFRGADYDPAVTTDHHTDGHHAYLLAETVLQANLVVNLPKVKTHKKTGVTLALKNLVGINGDKNWLPHHSVGAPSEGGDEFPQDRWIDRLRSRGVEIARPWLSRGRALGLFRSVRRLETAVRGTDFVRSGNWWGNRTTWRMCCDLNRAFYYSDREGLHLGATEPVRTVLTVLDGVVAGEGAGPLAPRDVGMGAVIAATDPVAADLVALQLMGFDWRRVPKVAESLRDTGRRITAVRDPADVLVVETRVPDLGLREVAVSDLHSERPFAAHPGWRGHIERGAA